uniref:Carbohydrate ABC transporter permease n=1 Tax=Candidatus Caldatribacterium saccharofermentans TaxID=1454753 RepID=A0A7V4TFV6_9BACT
MMKQTASQFFSAVINGILLLFCASYIFPFAWLFYTSLKSQKSFLVNMFGPPIPPTLENYQKLFSDKALIQALFNSFFNCLLSIILIVVFSFSVGYVLARYNFKGRNLLYLTFVAAMLVPVHALLVPTYVYFGTLNLLNKRFTLLLPYVTFGLPVAIYLYESYIRTIPKEIEEAARIDGASTSYVMLRVIFPICLPITGTVILLNFMGIWNEFPFALVLASHPRTRTVTVWLSTLTGLYSGSIPLRLTALLVACLPIIIVFILLRQKMIESVAAGAIKGF